MANPIVSPNVPGYYPIPGGVFPGRVIRVKGCIPPNAKSFIINLQCGPSAESDLPFHIHFHFPEKSIVRDHRVSSKWGGQESTKGMPLSHGKAFEMLLLCDVQAYKLALDGAHFSEFFHRVPFHMATHIGVEGDVSISYIGFEGVAPPQCQIYPRCEAPAPPSACRECC